jgi:hypothetical protein
VPFVVSSAIEDGREKDNNDDEKKSGGLLLGDFPRDTAVVLVGPPRKGRLLEFFDQLNEYRPMMIEYMSWEPGTQARDSKLLLSFGYHISSIQPFNLFPQSRHIECLAVFERMDDGDVQIMVK